MLTISPIFDSQFVFDRQKDQSCFDVLFGFLLFEKMDQRTCIKFCIKNEIKCSKTIQMLSVAFGESTMTRTQVQLWYNRFKDDREEVNDDSQQPTKTVKQ